MQTKITDNGQTLVPDAIRQHFGLDTSTRLEWIVEDNSIRVIPIQINDPIAAFRGQGKGGATQRLLAERHQDET